MLAEHVEDFISSFSKCIKSVLWTNKIAFTCINKSCGRTENSSIVSNALFFCHLNYQMFASFLFDATWNLKIYHWCIYIVTSFRHCPWKIFRLENFCEINHVIWVPEIKISSVPNTLVMACGQNNPIIFIIRK